MSFLKRRREQLNMTQEQVADAMGVTHQAWGYWERGKVPPRLDKAQKIADVLRVKRETVEREILRIARSREEATR